MKTYVLVAAAIATSLAGLSSSAKACDGFYHGGWSGWGAGYLYETLQNNVPHFAAFPPVYYSYPVPRTYGHSPFAYPPGVLTPEIVGAAEPVEIVNPYVPSSQNDESDEASADQQTSVAAPQPLVIHNPYFQGGKAVARVER